MAVGEGIVSFLEDSSMVSAFLRTVLLYGLLSSILRYLFPKKFKGFFGGKAMEVVAKSGEGLKEESSAANLAVGRDELRRVFSTFDKNGDGLISQQEMTESLEKLGLKIGEEEVLSAIKKVDANGDGNVDFEEFVMFYADISKVGEGATNLEEDPELADAFAVFDGNGDGLITAEELQSVMCSLGLKEGRTAGDCRNMIRQVDMDGDGMVNYAEFKEMMKSAFAKKT
ncbi:hypothetical protein SUGI_0484360 [Cryptomeria japonica]|uniref:calmodulin-like protein 3 n=1 Tax=Cryptomeria japonica TaxID=3369 RepID=UPI002408E53E|nr:calmodulin-like protein 3 [Cryptomeria japonica]GLJ25305.1 hypothetical protein SUGI_0484360 [Cryptomeria japonica]